MTKSQTSAIETNVDILNLIEDLAQSNMWDVERPNAEEIILTIAGRWAAYRIHLFWQEDTSILYMACLADLQYPSDADPTPLYEMLALMNQKLWLGHFGLLGENNVTFRHTLPLRGMTHEVSTEQLEDLIDFAVGEYETYYPAFEALIQKRGNVDEILDTLLLDTMGEA